MWKDIEGYEGLYQVSDQGEVKSLERIIHKKNTDTLLKERILKPCLNRGYHMVSLSINNKIHKFTVHRLVAKAFIPNPDNLPMVNHKDENPSNNCVDNLEWCDNKYNINYGTAIQRRAAKRKRPVKQLSLNGELIKIWDSAVDAGKELGIDRRLICNCCRGQSKTSKGYRWEYDN